MNRLEKLTQNEDGRLYQADGMVLTPERTIPKGKIRTLVVANPCLDRRRAGTRRPAGRCRS